MYSFQKHIMRNMLIVWLLTPQIPYLCTADEYDDVSCVRLQRASHHRDLSTDSLLKYDSKDI